MPRESGELWFSTFPVTKPAIVLVFWAVSGNPRTGLRVWKKNTVLVWFPCGELHIVGYVARTQREGQLGLGGPSGLTGGFNLPIQPEGPARLISSGLPFEHVPTRAQDVLFRLYALDRMCLSPTKARPKAICFYASSWR